MVCMLGLALVANDALKHANHCVLLLDNQGAVFVFAVTVVIIG